MTPDEQIGKDITDIKVSIAKIESYMKTSEEALKQVWDNKDNITNLKTKQGLVQWIGSSIFMGIVIYIIRGYWTKH